MPDTPKPDDYEIQILAPYIGVTFLYRWRLVPKAGGGAVRTGTALGRLPAIDAAARARDHHCGIEPEWETVDA